jgi:hypothetical protein
MQKEIPEFRTSKKALFQPSCELQRIGLELDQGMPRTICGPRQRVIAIGSFCQKRIAL